MTLAELSAVKTSSPASSIAAVEWQRAAELITSGRDLFGIEWHPRLAEVQNDLPSLSPM